MSRRNFVALCSAAGLSLAALTSGCVHPDASAAPQRSEETVQAAAPKTGYAPVNGLQMYYEIHGTGQPLVLLHGALTTVDTSFGKLLPGLAKTRQVIAVEQQAHGHTADIDRPLSYEQMADDTAALLRHLGVQSADIFGYSMGGGVALQLAIRHPDLVRKLVVAAASYNSDGMYPEMLAGIEHLTPEALAGSPFEQDYLRTAPNPAHWSRLVNKVKELDMKPQAWPPETIQAIRAPTLTIIGDSDIIRPEHAVAMFRLRGGGVPGDLTGLPSAQLAVLPGTTHVSLIDRADLLLPIIPAFLDAPLPKAP
ncbi:alpha/beta fold hydrolase [Pyxidicoccus sp. 3LFB2]